MHHIYYYVVPKVILPDAPGALRLKYSGLNQSHPWVNLFYLKYPGAKPTNIELNGLAVTLSGVWNSAWAAAFPTSASLVRTDVWDLSSRDGAVGQDTTSHTGTHAGTNPLPVNCAVCVSWHVTYRWRGGHPRTYIPAGYIADISTGSQLQDLYNSLVNAQAAAFLTTINNTNFGGGKLNLQTVRYYENGGSETDPPTPMTTPRQLAIDNQTVHKRLDSMRRRTGKETI